MKSIQIALLIALLLPAAAEVSADSRPSKSSSSSYKSGFSSQRSAPTSSNRSTSGNSSFGSFGNRQAAPPPRAPAPAPPPAGRNGGFGSFGNAAPRQDSAAPLPRKSESALSQSMNKSNAEANALRSLEARRAAQEAANAPREIRPVPSGPLPSNGQYGNAQNGQYGAQQGGQQGGQYGSQRNGQYGGGMPVPMPLPQPQQMQQNSGLMNVITGFLLARATTNTHAHGNSNNGYPGSTAATVSREDNGSMAAAAGANAIPAQSAPKSSFGMSVLRTMAWLAILAALGWLVYFVWKFLRRGKAPSTANYSFERN